MYKLIAIDMDGTLLNEKKEITPNVLDAIQRAKKAGVYVVLATGRPLIGIKRYIDMLKVDTLRDYVASFNGCMIVDVETQGVISETLLTGKDMKNLYNLSKELHVCFHAFTKEGCVTDKMSEYTSLEGSLNKIDILVKDINCYSDSEPCIKAMMVDDPVVLDTAISKFPKEIYDKYTVVKSAPFFVEFLNKKADKWEGIKSLAKHLNIDPSEVIAIGDAGNDLSMIKNAGLGIAMANGFDEVKRNAKFITKSNEEDGVAFAIDKFIFGK